MQGNLLNIFSRKSFKNNSYDIYEILLIKETTSVQAELNQKECVLGSSSVDTLGKLFEDSAMLIKLYSFLFWIPIYKF